MSGGLAGLISPVPRILEGGGSRFVVSSAPEVGTPILYRVSLLGPKGPNQSIDSAELDPLRREL